MSYPLVSGHDEVMALIEVEVLRGGDKVLMQRQPVGLGRMLNWWVSVGMVRFELPGIIIFGRLTS
jgi:hypothetical protein